MADLVSQISELIDILEAIDPQAAAQFRGGAGRVGGGIGLSLIQPTQLVEQPAEPVMSATIVPQPPRQTTKAGKHPHPTPESGVSVASPLNLNLTPDTLIQGIILAEVLGQPVSRRHRR